MPDQADDEVADLGNGQLGQFAVEIADPLFSPSATARVTVSIRCAKDTGLANLPLHHFAQNEIWCAIVALAADLGTWMQTLALAGHEARRWEPKRLRLRLFSLPARHARTGRRRLLHLAANPLADTG